MEQTDHEDTDSNDIAWAGERRVHLRCHACCNGILRIDLHKHLRRRQHLRRRGSVQREHGSVVALGSFQFLGGDEARSPRARDDRLVSDLVQRVSAKPLRNSLIHIQGTSLPTYDRPALQGRFRGILAAEKDHGESQPCHGRSMLAKDVEGPRRGTSVRFSHSTPLLQAGPADCSRQGGHGVRRNLPGWRTADEGHGRRPAHSVEG